LLYAAVFHFFAGVLTGSVFRIRTLIAVLFLVLSEVVVFAAMASEFAAVWAVGNLIAVQMGYCAGIYLRRLAEQAGYSVPPVQARSPE
jgi:hypothetical protein